MNSAANVDHAFRCWSKDIRNFISDGGGLIRVSNLEDCSVSLYNMISRPADPLFGAIIWGFDDDLEGRLRTVAGGPNAVAGCDERPALDLAVKCRIRRGVVTLLDHGADPEMLNNENETASMIGTACHNPFLEHIFLDRGADAEPYSDLEWWYAREYTLTLSTKLLLIALQISFRCNSNRAPIDAPDEYYETPLRLAVDNGHEEVTRFKTPEARKSSETNAWFLHWSSKPRKGRPRRGSYQGALLVEALAQRRPRTAVSGNNAVQGGSNT